jgi:Phage tail-collar fibre protein
MNDSIIVKGYIKIKIKDKLSGRVDILRFNTVLNSGRKFLANCLLEYPSKPYIANMLFGDGGTVNGEPKEVLPTQDKLNGVVRIRKPVVAQLDPDVPNQAIFSVMLGYDEGNDLVINEMALELSDENLFSLSTFSDLNKTDQMEITYGWFVQFI